jgi:hypothetical protein
MAVVVLVWWHVGIPMCMMAWMPPSSQQGTADGAVRTAAQGAGGAATGVWPADALLMPLTLRVVVTAGSVLLMVLACVKLL